MATLSRIVSNLSSLERLFDKEMLQKLYIMRDMVQEFVKDRKEKTILQEKLMAMKKEKQELLENMHEMETQLHIENETLAKMHEMETKLHIEKETLAKYVHEKEVCNSILSSSSSQDKYFGAFERHTRGIGSNY